MSSFDAFSTGVVRKYFYKSLMGSTMLQEVFGYSNYVTISRYSKQCATAIFDRGTVKLERTDGQTDTILKTILNGEPRDWNQRSKNLVKIIEMAKLK
jgi:hypothetical protein